MTNQTTRLTKTQRRDRWIAVVTARASGMTWKAVATSLGLPSLNSALDLFNRGVQHILLEEPTHPLFDYAQEIEQERQARKANSDAIGAPTQYLTGPHVFEFENGLVPSAVSAALVARGDWAALGFAHWLLNEWPTEQDRAGRSYVVNRSWGDICTSLAQYGLDEDAIIPLLRRLEDVGLLWLIQRGQDILELEPR